MLVADPHMYVTEVRFYEDIRPTLECETPSVYAWALEPETCRFAVVLEDLALRSATFPSALSELTAHDVEPLMTTLARLHATNSGSSWPRAPVQVARDIDAGQDGGVVARWRARDRRR